MSGGHMPPHFPRESLKSGILEIQASQKQVQACLSALGKFSTDYVLGCGSTTHTDLKNTLQYYLQLCEQFFEQHCARCLDFKQHVEQRQALQQTAYGVNTVQEAAFATDMSDDLADSKALAYLQHELREAMWYTRRVKTTLLQCLAQETIIQDNILYVSCKLLKSAVHEMDSAGIQPNTACKRISSARLAYMKICVDAFDVAHNKHVVLNDEIQLGALTPCSFEERFCEQVALFATECLDVKMVHKICGQLADFKHVHRMLFGYFFRFVLQQINIFQIAVLVRIDMHIEEYESNALTQDAATGVDVDGPLHRKMLAAHCACRVRFERVRRDSARLMHDIAANDGQTVLLTIFDAALQVLTRLQALRNELGNITRRWDDMMQDKAAHPPDSLGLQGGEGNPISPRTCP